MQKEKSPPRSGAISYHDFGKVGSSGIWQRKNKRSKTKGEGEWRFGKIEEKLQHKEPVLAENSVEKRGILANQAERSRCGIEKTSEVENKISNISRIPNSQNEENDDWDLEIVDKLE